MSTITIREKVILNEVAETLDELGDVNIAGAAEGDVLTREGSQWVNKPQGSLSVTLENVQSALEKFEIGAAISDGTTNDATVVSNALNAIVANGGGELYLGDGTTAIGTQIYPASLQNTRIVGTGKTTLKKIAPNTTRVIGIGQSNYPSSTTVPQAFNVRFGPGIKYQGFATLVPGNNAITLNNSGNFFEFQKPLGVIFDGPYFSGVDNTCLRFVTNSEGNMFDAIPVDVPVRVNDTTFAVSGNQSAYYTLLIGTLVGLFDGSQTVVDNMKTCGRVATVVYNAGLARTEIGLTFAGIVSTKAVVVATTLTGVGRIRTETAFKGFNIVKDGLFQDCRQMVSGNDSLTQFSIFQNLMGIDSGSLKLTTKLAGSGRYQFLDRVIFRNCGERLFLQSADGVFCRDLVSVDGAGVNATAYGAALIAHNQDGGAFLRADMQNFLFHGGISEGDYQGLYFIGQTDFRIEQITIAHRFFKDITAVRSGTGVLSFSGRFRKIIIDGVQMKGIGTGINCLNFIPHMDAADTYIEEIHITNCQFDGGRYWLNLDGGSMTRPVKRVVISGVTARNCKGIYLRNVEEVVFDDTCNFDFLPFDGTAGWNWGGAKITIRGKWNVQTGSTSALNMFALTGGSSDIFFDGPVIRAADSNVSGIVASGGTLSNIRIRGADIDVGNDAITLTGAGLTGEVIGCRLKGGGSGALYDLIIGSGVGAVTLKDNDYLTSNISVDFTGVTNEKLFTWNPPSIAAGGTATTTFTFTGAVIGDRIEVSAPYDLQGLMMSAYVSAADTVTVVLFNPTAGAIDLANNTGWRAKRFKVGS